MGVSNSVNPPENGDMVLFIYFHFEKLIEKWYDSKTAHDQPIERKVSNLSQTDSKIVEEYDLNQELLSCTLEEI